MRKLIRQFIDKLCRARARRRLSRYFAGTSAQSLDHLALDLDTVPGMMSFEAGVMLFMLSAMQRSRGDIIEIGSWQGRSTIFLAKGAIISGNGTVYAIDHFLGNPGKEHLYRAGRDDLADLETVFNKNIRSFDVSGIVELLPVRSKEAAEILNGRSVRARLLFIDGNHDYEAVREDYDAFSPYVIPGGVVVFDDFSSAFPGVVQCVEDLVSAGKLKPSFTYGNTFVGEAIKS